MFEWFRFWNKGKYGFWIVGLKYMRGRDLLIQRMFYSQGRQSEREYIIKLLKANEKEMLAESKKKTFVMDTQTVISLIEGYKNG